jgi:hypothetical protein
MKRFFFISCFLLGLFLFSSGVYGQKIQADTTLTYERFLQESRGLAQKEKIEEVWVVTFWASFNGKSLNSIDEMKKLMPKYKNKPIRFVFITGDKNRKSWIKAMSDRKMIGEHFYLGDTAKYSDLRRRFQHNSLPSIFMYDKAGLVIRKKNVDELASTLVVEAKNLPDHPYGWTPPPVKETPPPPPTEEELLRGWVFHVVKKGESLFSIARRYGLSVTGLQTVNGMADNNVYIGQKIKIRPDTNVAQESPAPSEK